MTPMKWFYSFLKKYWLRMVSGLILVTILAATALASPYISKLIVDDVIKKQNTGLLPKLIILFLAMVVIKGVCRFFSQLLLEDFAFYNKNRTGDLMGRQTGDMDAIRHFVAYVIYTVYENILYFVLSIVLIFMVNVKLAVCMMLVLPLTAATTYMQAKKVKPAFKNCRDAFSSLNTYS